MAGCISNAKQRYVRSQLRHNNFSDEEMNKDAIASLRPEEYESAKEALRNGDLDTLMSLGLINTGEEPSETTTEDDGSTTVKAGPEPADAARGATVFQTLDYIRIRIEGKCYRFGINREKLNNLTEEDVNALNAATVDIENGAVLSALARLIQADAVEPIDFLPPGEYFRFRLGTWIASRIPKIRERRRRRRREKKLARLREQADEAGEALRTLNSLNEGTA